MLQQHSSPKPTSFFMLILVVVIFMTLVLQPRFQARLFNSQRVVEPSLSAQEMWQFNDLWRFGSRKLWGTTIPEGPILQEWPDLHTLVVARASEFTSQDQYVLDLILAEEETLSKLEVIFNEDVSQLEKGIRKETTNGTQIIKLFAPEEAQKAHGYYYEDRNLTNNYWLHIGNYSL